MKTRTAVKRSSDMNNRSPNNELDLESRYGFAKKFASSSTSDLLKTLAKTLAAEKSKPGSGQARTYFLAALKAELGRRKQEITSEQPTSYDKFAPRPKIDPEVLAKMFVDVARFVREEKQILEELKPHLDVIRRHKKES